MIRSLLAKLENTREKHSHTRQEDHPLRQFELDQIGSWAAQNPLCCRSSADGNSHTHPGAAVTRNSTNEIVSSWTAEFNGILPWRVSLYWLGRHVALFMISLADLQNVVFLRVVVENCEQRNRSQKGRHGQIDTWIQIVRRENRSRSTINDSRNETLIVGSLLHCSWSE